MKPMHVHGAEEQQAGKEQETRRRILQAAQQLFLAKGFKGVSMKDIADEVQVTAAALYYHFPQGKQEIFVAMFQHFLEGWNTGAVQVTQEVAGFRERLVAVATYMLNIPIRELMTLMRDIEGELLQECHKQTLFSPSRESFDRLVQGIFHEASEQGEIKRDVPVEALAAMFQGMVMGMQQPKPTPDGPVFLPQMGRAALAEMIVNSFLHGILAPQD